MKSLKLIVFKIAYCDIYDFKCIFKIPQNLLINIEFDIFILYKKILIRFPTIAALLYDMSFLNNHF